VSDDRRVIVERDGAAVGRAVRAALDAGEHAAGFVGDPDEDADALAEFATDVVNPSSSSTPSSE
jgi:hypothetical protein